MEKLVSIVLPCYNVAKYLKKNSESLLNQTYKNLEIIYVNDGSKDDTLSLLNEIAASDSRIVVVDKVNGGVSSARNAGLKRASGEYITFCDPDDYVSPLFIEAQVTTLEKYGADACVCKYKRVKEGKTLKFSKKLKTNIVEFDTEGAIAKLMSGVDFDVCCWNKLFKREVLEGVSFREDIYYAEDAHFDYFAFKNVKKLVYNPSILYAYVMRKGSLVKSKFSERKLTGLVGLKQVCDDSDKHFDFASTVSHAWYSMVHLEMLYYCFRDKYENYETINNLLKEMGDNLPYLKKAKNIQLYRRLLVPVAHKLCKVVFARREKKFNKQKSKAK